MFVTARSSPRLHRRIAGPLNHQNQWQHTSFLEYEGGVRCRGRELGYGELVLRVTLIKNYRTAFLLLCERDIGAPGHANSYINGYTQAKTESTSQGGTGLQQATSN